MMTHTNLEFPSKVLQDLREMRALLADPSRWTTGVLARDESGMATNSTSPDATCWCLLGAARKVCDDSSYYNYNYNTVDAMHASLPPKFESIGDFNDAISHEEMLSWLDEVIASMEQA